MYQLSQRRNSTFERNKLLIDLGWKRLQFCKSRLKTLAHIAGFLAGFAIITAVELQINRNDVKEGLLIAFAITTVCLVSISFLAISTSALLLPYLKAIDAIQMVSLASSAPHDKMLQFIEISWTINNTASILLFTLDLILMCWIKFNIFTPLAPLLATLILTPVMLTVFFLGIIFYRKNIKQKVEVCNREILELEKINNDINVMGSLEKVVVMSRKCLPS